MAGLLAADDTPEVRANLVGAALVDRVAGEALLLEQRLALVDVGILEFGTDRRQFGGRRGGDERGCGECDDDYGDDAGGCSRPHSEPAAGALALQQGDEMAHAVGAAVSRLQGVGHWWMIENPVAGADMLTAHWAA